MNIGTAANTKHMKFGESLFNDFIRIPYAANSSAISRETVYLLNRLRDKAFKIAVVGEFSSGKSTFLNAIAGKDYLLHGVKETTAAVTMLINKNEPQGTLGRVIFNDGNIMKLKDYNQLKDVTTAQSSAYKVSSQIDLVEIYTPFMETDVPIVLVDTPGLNGVAAMHKERTVDIIQGVHACIYMLQSRGITETDRKSLQWIAQYQSELIVIQNFIDNINQSEGDTLEDLLNKQRDILSGHVFKDIENVSYTVCGVSAMKALAAKDTSITYLYHMDKTPLSEEDRKRLYTESNMEQTMESIKNFMENGFQRAHLSTLQSVLNLLERTEHIISRQYENQNVLWAETDKAQIVLRAQQLLDNWESRQNDHARKLDNFIISKMNECKRLTLSELRNMTADLENTIPGILNKIITPDDWDVFNHENKMSLFITDGANAIRRFIEEFLVKFCKNTHYLAVLRIQEYAGLTDVSENKELPEFHIKSSDGGIRPFTREANDLEKEIAGLNELQKQRYFLKSKIEQLQEEEKRLSHELALKHQRKSAMQKEYEHNNRRLGRKPDPATYYDNVSTEVYRGGFWGGIADFFAGPQIVTKTIEKKDYTAQNKWAEDERNIKNAFNKQKMVLNNQISSLEKGLSAANQELHELDETKNNDETRINRKKVLINEMKASLELKKTLAAKEYVQKQKEKLKNSASDYIQQLLKPSLEEIISHEAAQMIENLISAVRELYDDISRSQKESLRQMIGSNGTGKAELDALAHDIKNITLLRKKLEDYLCKP